MCPLENQHPQSLPPPGTSANVRLQDAQRQGQSPGLSSFQTLMHSTEPATLPGGRERRPKNTTSSICFQSYYFNKGRSGDRLVCCVLQLAQTEAILSTYVSGKQTSSGASLSRTGVGAARSHPQSLLPFDMQNLSGIWVHLPRHMTSSLHHLWLPLQKSNILPSVEMKPPPCSRKTHQDAPGAFNMFTLPSPTLPKKSDPQGKNEREAKPISHLAVESFF